MKSHVRRRKYSSYKTGLVLLGLLLVIWFLVRGLNTSGLPSGLASLINSDFENFRNLEQFGEERSKEIQKQLGGFWTYSEGDPEKSPVAKREYMELNPNGMLWYVKDWAINTPDGERQVLTHVVNGYVNPYSYSPGDSAYYCETRIIRQIYIFNDADTCHGASQQDEIWQISRSGDGGKLNVNRREYQQYTGDIKEFFPDTDQLDLVDQVTVGACAAATDLSYVSKKLLARSLDAVPFFIRAQMVDSLIRAYYRPMVFDELARRYDPRAVPDVMAVRLTVSPEGAVSDLRYKSAKLVTKRFDDLAVMDMRGWLFPPVGDSQDPQSLELKVRVK